MSDETKEVENKIDQPNFAEMDRGKLMQYASHLRIAFPNTATKSDLIEMIDNKLKGRTTAKLADNSTKVPPGHAKIRINEDPMPGASNFPIYINANGYECTIPRGKDVIVPMRVVRTLQDASVKRRKQTSSIDAQGREFTQESEIVVPSYPYQVLEMNPGPEPLTNLEKSKLKSIRPRERYRDKFGYWPQAGQLRGAIEKGLISLEENEELSASEIRLMEKNL